MPFSMTGFGSSSVDTSIGKIAIEIQSINRKHLDINLSTPKEFAKIESDIRKKIGEKITRGQINVRIYFTPNFEADFLPDPTLLKKFKEVLEKTAVAVGSDPRSIDFPFLLSQYPMGSKGLTLKEEDVSLFDGCLEKALLELLDMKEKEGNALIKDLKGRLNTLETFLGSIANLAPDTLIKIRANFKEKLKTLSMDIKGENLEEALAKELFFQAERLDFTEELTRLKSHFTQFDKLLSGNSGKKLDFLIQEMGRETNTIGSKAQDVQIAHLVVEMKAELEKMREQIQNLE